MRIAVIGSRQCGNLTVEDVLAQLPANCTEIVSGGAVGVDDLARQAARKRGLRMTEFFPDYETFGRKAPLVRNRQIVDYAQAVLAFWDYQSNGTRQVILYARKVEKPVQIVIIHEEGDFHL